MPKSKPRSPRRLRLRTVTTALTGASRSTRIRAMRHPAPRLIRLLLSLAVSPQLQACRTCLSRPSRTTNGPTAPADSWIRQWPSTRALGPATVAAPRSLRSAMPRFRCVAGWEQHGTSRMQRYFCFRRSQFHHRRGAAGRWRCTGAGRLINRSLAARGRSSGVSVR